MTLDDISDLLALCAQYDGRTINDDTAAAWLLLLEDIPAEDAAEAVRTHYRTDRRWIMPADIVAHHEKLAAARLLDQERMSPPACWGTSCPVRYVTSPRPGSTWAFPDRDHHAGCNAMQGMLSFTEGKWGVMPGLDPATFDEVEWEAGQARLAAAAERNGSLSAALGLPGPCPDWAGRLAISGEDQAVD